MHTLGDYVGAQRNLDGDLYITFAVDDEKSTLEALDKLKEKRLVLDIKKYSEKRSLNANAYFWKLCDEIAKKLGSDKDTVYLMQLQAHGIYDWVEVVEPAVKYLEPVYRAIEIDHYYNKPMVDETGSEYTSKMAAVKCYIGSSQYDSKQMADLINGTVNDADDLGIETWSREEIDNLVSRWEGHNV